MNKKMLLCFCVAVPLVFAAPVAIAQNIGVGKDGNIRNVDARALVSGRDSFYLATKCEVYKTCDMKDNWETVFTLPSGTNEIHCLASRGRDIFVGTRRGLFRSNESSASCQNVFKTMIPEKSDILSIEIAAGSGGAIYIGTSRGVFVSDDSGKSWKDISGGLKDSPVTSITIHNGLVYAGAGSGVFVNRAGRDGWERLLVKNAESDIQQNETPEEPQDQQEEEAASAISFVVSAGKRLYIALNKNILYSEDDAKSWRTYPSGGLGGAVKCILPSRKRANMYCATTKGVFEFLPKDGRWRELYKGKDKAIRVNSILFGNDDEGLLWALSDEGLYRFEPGQYVPELAIVDVEKNMRQLKVVYDSEPPFKDLQRAAMKFAEVEPEKIEKWRKEARLKSVVPKVSVGLDKNRSSNAEIYTSASKDYVVVGPDDVTNGWDVSVSWDLSALIWSDDQTNIDVRSRLTTQLRNDILDDLRRAYYERKRLQFELMNMPPVDPKMRFEKELRIQELAQAIDDLTGNYLSEHTKK